jgi:hypothetical protein
LLPLCSSFAPPLLLLCSLFCFKIPSPLLPHWSFFASPLSLPLCPPLLISSLFLSVQMWALVAVMIGVASAQEWRSRGSGVDCSCPLPNVVMSTFGPCMLGANPQCCNILRYRLVFSIYLLRYLNYSSHLFRIVGLLPRTSARELGLSVRSIIEFCYCLFSPPLSLLQQLRNNLGGSHASKPT